MKHKLLLAAVLLIVASLAVPFQNAHACPYCTIESMTLTEEIASSDVVILARLITEPFPASDEPLDDEKEESNEFGFVNPDTGRARFRIERVIVGEELLHGAKEPHVAREIEAIYFGEDNRDGLFFIRGIGVEQIDWNVPMALSDVAVKYVEKLGDLPESGPDRLAFFLDYLQHDDPTLAQDAYGEFALAPYADVLGIADLMNHDRLWQWIRSREVSPSRRSLYFVMLGVCGNEEDRNKLRKMMLADDRVLRSAAEASAAAAMGLGGPITLPALPEMVSMDQRRKQLGFNAMVGCYLKLGGEQALDEVDELFLANPNAHPSKVFGTLVALRFLAEESDQVSLDRLIESMQLALDKPNFAEQAITDLARWQDWTVLDKLVTMFKEAKPKTYIKEPIVAYLDQASQQPGDIGERATAAIAELEKIDPRAVKSARSLAKFGFLGRARAQPTPKQEDKPIGGDALDVETPDQLEEPPAEEPPAEATDEKAGEKVIPAETQPTSEPPTNDSATEPTEPAVDTYPRPNMQLVVTLPIVVTAVMMGLVWVILRGGV